LHNNNHPPYWYQFRSGVSLILGINNNNNYDNVYDAIIMTKVIARVHPVHSMNVDECQVAANPHTKPVDLGCESSENWLLPSISTITIVIITQPVGSYSFYRPTRVKAEPT